MRCSRKACVYCDDHTGECGYAPVAGAKGLLDTLYRACGHERFEVVGCDACMEVEPEALEDCQGGSCRL